MSGYPDYMLESLKLVERTRPSRIGKALPEMTAEEKKNVLRNWHPDFPPVSSSGTMENVIFPGSFISNSFMIFMANNIAVRPPFISELPLPYNLFS